MKRNKEQRARARIFAWFYIKKNEQSPEKLENHSVQNPFSLEEEKTEPEFFGDISVSQKSEPLQQTIAQSKCMNGKEMHKLKIRQFQTFLKFSQRNSH